MPKCDHKRANARVRVHTPGTTWHGHRDFTVEVSAPTEFEMWAQVFTKLLLKLTGSSVQLQLGYLGDALNTLPLELRKALISIIAQGYGLEIQLVPDEAAIEVGLTQRYEPLVAAPETQSGLVVPKSGKADLVIPGNPQYPR